MRAHIPRARGRAEKPVFDVSIGFPKPKDLNSEQTACRNGPETNCFWATLNFSFADHLMNFGYLKTAAFMSSNDVRKLE
jgi:hypothetical protein